MAQRKRVSFMAKKPIKKNICFKTKDGRKVCFKVRKTQKVKVSFYAKKSK